MPLFIYFCGFFFFHDRPVSAADEESFEKDLERQLEDELQLDELKKAQAGNGQNVHGEL